MYLWVTKSVLSTDLTTFSHWWAHFSRRRQPSGGNQFPQRKGWAWQSGMSKLIYCDDWSSVTKEGLATNLKLGLYFIHFIHFCSIINTSPPSTAANIEMSEFKVLQLEYWPVSSWGFNLTNLDSRRCKSRDECSFFMNQVESYEPKTWQGNDPCAPSMQEFSEKLLGSQEPSNLAQVTGDNKGDKYRVDLCHSRWRSARAV